MKMFPSRRRWQASLTAAVLAVALAGCASTDDGDEQGAARGGDLFVTGTIDQPDGGDPQSGGTLRFGAFSEPSSLDPARAIVAGSTGGIELAAIYDVLMRQDVDSSEVVPQLAKGLEANDDSTEWVLTLREGVEFSDGEPLDADAVVASIERYLAAGGGDSALWKENVKSTEVTGPLEVTFTLRRTWPGFDTLLTGGAGMIVAPSAGKVDSPKFEPVGAGPFTFVEHRPSEVIKLAANADYWNGRPHLDGVEVAFVDDPVAIHEAMETGQFDMGFLRDPKVIHEAIESGYGGSLEVVAGGKALVLNAAKGRDTADVTVRRAISAAMDPTVIIERAHDGYGVPTSSMFPDSFDAAPDVDIAGFDLDLAKELVEEAKQEGFDGKVDLLTANSPDLRDTATVIKAMLGAAGIEVNVDTVQSSSETVNRVAGGDYDMAAWGLSWREATAYSRLFVTLHSEGNLNHGWATSPELDRAIEDLQAAGDDEALEEGLGAVQEAYEEVMPAVPYAAMPEYTGWLPEVHGVASNANGVVLLEKAWIEQ